MTNDNVIQNDTQNDVQNQMQQVSTDIGGEQNTQNSSQNNNDLAGEINFNIVEVASDFYGSPLSLQTGHLARLADASVVCKYGDTTVLCSVVYDKNIAAKNDFFPLMVIYQEKYYAANKIPGGFLKREAKLTDAETLISRLIDRTIRPMFDERFCNEVQVICTVLSYDGKHSPVFAAMTAVSAALKISGTPFLSTVAGINVGFDGNNFGFNVSGQSLLDLFVSGTKDSIMMIESQAHEITEEQIINAIAAAHEQIKTICDFVDHFASKVQPKSKFILQQQEDLTFYKNKIENMFAADIANAFQIKDKSERGAMLEAIKQKIVENCNAFEKEKQTSEEKATANDAIVMDEIKKSKVMALYKDIQKNIMRARIIKDKIRIDGRRPDQIRPISISTSILPGVHGSALFTRGETQALVATTIGGEKEAQLIDNLEGLSKQPFMLNYNFPPYSVNELGRYGAPGRREIGHGNLAFRALEVMLPSKRNMPYSIRVVSEILESNGSSSMATVCGGCLSILNAGIPMTRPVSGIAMGLIKEGNDVVILSDILGDEDHLGDMDFKVAGTEKGITALQMDIKILGVDIQTIANAINQAKGGREYILNKMLPHINKGQSQGNSNESNSNNSSSEGGFAQTSANDYLDAVSEIITIDPTRVREIIGQGGSVINAISSQSNCQIDISQNDGSIKIVSSNHENIANAKRMIESVLVKFEIGEIYDVTVNRVVDSYAIVTTESGKSGMLHISEVSYSNLDDISVALVEGEKLKAKVIEISDGGRAKFSIKNIEQITGREFKIVDSQIVYL